MILSYPPPQLPPKPRSSLIPMIKDLIKASEIKLNLLIKWDHYPKLIEKTRFDLNITREALKNAQKNSTPEEELILYSGNGYSCSICGQKLLGEQRIICGNTCREILRKNRSSK